MGEAGPLISKEKGQGGGKCGGGSEKKKEFLALINFLHLSPLFAPLLFDLARSQKSAK